MLRWGWSPTCKKISGNTPFCVRYLGYLSHICLRIQRRLFGWSILFGGCRFSVFWDQCCWVIGLDLIEYREFGDGFQSLFFMWFWVVGGFRKPEHQQLADCHGTNRALARMDLHWLR